MISMRSIGALTSRYLSLLLYDINVKIATFYWPFLDIVLWGFLGSWIQGAQAGDFANYQAVALLCIVLWQVAVRSAQSIFKCMLEELWTRNLVNMFSLPISLTEWIVAVILYSAIMTLIIVTFCVLLIVALYSISVWYLLSALLLFAPPLFISGIWLGFICLQTLAYFGKRADEIGWVVTWFFAPFSGVFYPVDILPLWAQRVSYCLPMSHAITGMRNYLIYHEDPTHSLIIAYVMSAVYALTAIMIFAVVFNGAKQKGLVRLFN